MGSTNRTARRTRSVLLLIGIVAVLLVAYAGYEVLHARTALEQVSSDFQAVGAELTAGDTASARLTVERAARHAEEAHEAVSGPAWWLAGKVPGIRPNVHALQTVSETAKTLTDRVLPEVVAAAEVLRPERLRPRDGRVDLTPIAQVAPDVVRADRLLQAEVEDVAALDPATLAAPVADALRKVQGQLAEAAELSERASRAVRLLPPMLGADGKRRYLLMFQNNAEVRATGGIPGAFAIVTADNGRIRMGKQGDASDLGRFDRPPIPLTPAERRIYGEETGLYPQDVNFTPDFPRTAQLIKAMWQQRHQVRVDGVLSTDPVALSYLLEGTGPIRAPGGRQLTADNAVDLLLSEVYAEIPVERQDAFFAAVAGAVFEAVSSGRGDPRQVLGGLVRAAEERRILLWSAHPDEQRIIGPTALAGALVDHRDRRPNVGVFLNDATAGKMAYYLDYSVTLDSRRCRNDRQQLVVTMRMHSTAPPRGSGLPEYVSSGREVPRGHIRFNLHLYAPFESVVREVTLDGKAAGRTLAFHGGRPVTTTTIRLAPGADRVLSARIRTAAEQTGQPALRVTPSAQPGDAGVVLPSAC